MAAIAELGKYSVVSTVDLADIDHNVNYTGPDPVSYEGVSKFEGMMVIADIGGLGTDFCFAVSEGNASASRWVLLDGTSAPITPA